MMGVQMIFFLLAAIWLASSEAVLEPRCSQYGDDDRMLEKMIKMDVKMEQVLHELKGIDDISKFQNATEDMLKQMTNMHEMMVETEEKMENMGKSLGQLEQRMQDLVKLAIVNSSQSGSEKSTEHADEDKTDDIEDASMGKPCASNSTCTDVDKAECRDQLCKCLPGLSYRKSTRSCVEDCGPVSQYTDTYQHVKGMALWGYYSHKTTESSAEGCMAQCTKMTEIKCRMAEFKPSSGMCQVSYETLVSNASDAKEKSDYDVYVRNCV